MGFFDFFKSDKSEKLNTSEEIKTTKSSASKWADKAADKRAQPYDRQEALHKLADMGTADAAAALLKRFTFQVDPSITDQEEKEIAFRGVLAAKEEAIPVVRQFVKKAESLAWPMRIMKELLSKEDYVSELCAWLSTWDTEYAKFIDPKLQILAALEEYRGPRVTSGVVPFLEDVNETARFHSVVTLLAQEDETLAPALLKTLFLEESVRIQSRLVEGFFLRGWKIPMENWIELQRLLPYNYRLNSDGQIVK